MKLLTKIRYKLTGIHPEIRRLGREFDPKQFICTHYPRGVVEYKVFRNGDYRIFYKSYYNVFLLLEEEEILMAPGEVEFLGGIIERILLDESRSRRHKEYLEGREQLDKFIKD